MRPAPKTSLSLAASLRARRHCTLGTVVAPLLAAVTALSVSACKTTQSGAYVKDAGSNSYNGISITYFNSTSNTNGYSCSNTQNSIPPLNQIVAVTENSPLLEPANRFFCQDNFVYWQEGMQTPWASDHFLAKLTAAQRAQLFSRFPGSFRQQNSGWGINEPSCQTAMVRAGACGLNFQLQQTNGGDGQWHQVVLWDACPANHWNNAIKDDPLSPDYNFGGNPCTISAAHIDLQEALQGTFGPNLTSLVAAKLADGTTYYGTSAAPGAVSQSRGGTSGSSPSSNALGGSGVSGSGGSTTIGGSGNQLSNSGSNTGSSGSNSGSLGSSSGSNTTVQGSNSTVQGSNSTVQGGNSMSSGNSTGGSKGYISCPGNQYCNSGWGWLSAGVSGCSSSSVGWVGGDNGCSCSCQ